MAAKGFILYFFSKTVCVMESLCLLVNVDKNWLLSSGFFFSEKRNSKCGKWTYKEVGILTRRCLGGDRKKGLSEKYLAQNSFFTFFSAKNFSPDGQFFNHLGTEHYIFH